MRTTLATIAIFACAEAFAGDMATPGALEAAAGGEVKSLGASREVMWDMDRIAVLGGGDDSTSSKVFQCPSATGYTQSYTTKFAGYGYNEYMAGYGTSLNIAGSSGGFWSSVPSSGYDDSYAWGHDSYAWGLGFNSSGHDTGIDNRSGGHSVRPVQGFTE